VIAFDKVALLKPVVHRQLDGVAAVAPTVIVVVGDALGAVFVGQKTGIEAG